MLNQLWLSLFPHTITGTTSLVPQASTVVPTAGEQLVAARSAKVRPCHNFCRNWEHLGPSLQGQGLILYQDGTTRGVSFIPAELVMTRTTATIWNIGSRTSLIKSSWYSRGQALSKILFPFMKLEAVVPLLPSTWCSLFYAIRRAKRVSLLMSMNSRGCRVNLPIPTAM